MTTDQPAPLALAFDAPTRATVTLACPQCGQAVALEATFGVRLTRDDDGSRTLALRTRAPKLAHDCDQLTLDSAFAQGERVR